MESTERFSSRTEGFEAHTGLPSLGSCTGKTSPQDGWLWKPLGLAHGTDGGLLEQRLHSWGVRAKSQHTGRNLKEDLGQTSVLTLASFLGEAGGSWDSPWRQTLVQRSSFYHENNSAAKCHSGFLPPACQHLGPTHQPVDTHRPQDFPGPYTASHTGTRQQKETENIFKQS